MQSAHLVLALLIAVAALVTIARRLGIAYPIFLVIGGLLLGLVPGTPRVEIDPDLIFLFVLPPLLYIRAGLPQAQEPDVRHRRVDRRPDGEGGDRDALGLLQPRGHRQPGAREGVW